MLTAIGQSPVLSLDPEDAGIPQLHDSTFLGNEENFPEVFVHDYLKASYHEQHFKG